MKEINLEKNIYNFLRLIPKGKVISYGDLGEIFALNSRYVAEILSKNNKQDKFPCYKVVNKNGNIGGYNLGVNEKIRRLENDGIEIFDQKIKEKYFWRPKLFNFFVAFPLVEKEKLRFKEMNEVIIKNFEKEFKNKNFTLQNYETSHVTLKFIGDFTFEYMKILVNKIKNLFLEDKIGNINFYKVGNFFDRVFFFSPNISNEKKIYNYVGDLFTKLSLKKDDRKYKSHLTFLRVKNSEFILNNKGSLIDLVKNYSFEVDFSRIVIYVAVDRYFQIPLREFVLD